MDCPDPQKRRVAGTKRNADAYCYAANEEGGADYWIATTG